MKKILLPVFIILLFAQEFAYSDLSGWRRMIAKDTYDVWVNPKNPNTIFVGGGGHVVYRSYDGGYKWDTLETVPGLTGTSAHFNNLFIHPKDTNVILVAGLNFCQVRRSTDNGDTWEMVLSYPGQKGCLSTNGKSMFFKPDQPDTIYVGDFMRGVIYRSTNRGATLDSLSTIMTKWRFEDPNTGEIYFEKGNLTIGSMTIRDDSTNIILAGGTNSEVHISTDGGLTWAFTDVMASPLLDYSDSEITRMVFSDRNPRVGYAVITYLFYANRQNGSLYKTIDGGYTWDMVAFPDTSMWAVDCRKFGNTEEVFIGGYTEDFYVHDSIRVPGVKIVRRSQDGGMTWLPYDNTIDWYVKDQQYGPVANVWSIRYFGPEGKEKIYMASEAGAFVLDDPGASEVAGGLDEDEQSIFLSKKSDRTITLVYKPYNPHLRQKLRFRIVNSLGKLLKTASFSSNNQKAIRKDIYVPRLTPGLYICQVIEGLRSSSELIIID